MPELHPTPSHCPDCGSPSILRIAYGLPTPETLELVQRGEVILGGCCVARPRFRCSHCFHRWPEGPPPTPAKRTPDAQAAYLSSEASASASLLIQASLPPDPSEPTVVNFWERPDGRKAFLLQFPWGRLRLEKQLYLVPLGGPPIYQSNGHDMPPYHLSEKIWRLATVAALRFETRPRA